MKKVINIFILILFLFEITSIATTENLVSNLNITLDKEVVHPNEEVILNINFGEVLSEYEIDVAYDKNLFEYVSLDSDVNVEDNGNVVTISSISENFDNNQINITFKAKSDITTTNPTDFKVTLENLRNSSAEISNSLEPIKKELIVEPIYTDYEFDFSYDGEILENVEKDFKLVLKSKMGKNYSNTKIYASVINPEGAEVKIFANDERGVEYNFLEEGWGGQTGEPIGGENIVKELDLRGMFSKKGNYAVTFKLVDLNSRVYEITSKTFEIRVVEEVENNESLNFNETTGIGAVEAEADKAGNENSIATEEKKPTELPKAGVMIYYIIIPIAFFVTIIYVCLKNKDEEI